MSESEENFDLDVSDSEFDDYSPAAKKTTPKAKAKAPGATPAAKAAAKPKATKKRVLVDKDDNASERDEDSDADDMAGPSEPKPAGKKKTASETYTKLSRLEHILKRPDTYIGSVPARRSAEYHAGQ